MLRIVSMLFCAVFTVFVTAAPAPVYRTPKASEVWAVGWDKPEDPQGDSRFGREGGGLAITVRGHQRGRTNHKYVTCLLRDAQGDFDLRVRVRADFRRQEVAEGDVRRAGLTVAGNARYVRFTRSAIGGRPRQVHHVGHYEPGKGISARVLSEDDLPGERAAHLRLVRRGKQFFFTFSGDGTNWGATSKAGSPDLPRKVKVGVFAEATAPGSFKAVFDDFKLTTPSK